MTVDQLIKEIHTLYVQARYPIFRNKKLKHKRVFRGESRSISSYVEDLFAKYLIEKLPPDTNLFINQIISSGSKSKRIRIKPDIMIVRDDEIKAIIDLKMDLGYNRKEFPKFWKKKDAQISSIHGMTFSFYKKNEIEKTHSEISFSQKAKLFFIVISDGNMKEKYSTAIKKYKGKMKFSDIYFLLEGIHPNDPEITLKQLRRRNNASNVTLTKFNKALSAII